ncbi:type VII secretion protein EsaA [Edaphobacillus lindanitolerans]|uniref:Type VII secretion protein EsaA, N-terminal domain-containing protein n=1 Tax=Edaphobacillus lindanitolerans TaxID=550447 RepID=A0A1U7PKC7_9BACI|nr:type VII secretion protein EsaA [Edaphobacillus lindanitolerans]SIT70685.1 type VII secretion protein EsaA, N-terminal domain-containing protein [Edaphobacillus lindanitolerans]
MNKNIKKTAGLIAGIVAIIALPVLFFGMMSGNFMALAQPSERKIAVVNEDLGSVRDDEKVEMGREVVSILSEDSPYKWEVTGRGAAESGLKSDRYDAVLYVPSDFSESILSYDEKNPEKAEFTFSVQQQKSGTSKEKVLKEIERATDRVNTKVATLYWSYVAAEMDHVKKEFNTILEKESEFLDSMVGYYEPGSSSLADQLQRQREQMEQIQETVKSAGDDSHAARIDSVESFTKELSDFTIHVEQYKAFQLAQRGVLEELQGGNIAQIQTAAAKQAEQFQETLSSLKANNEQLAAELEKVNNQIESNKEKFNELEQLRLKRAEQQADEILAAQGTAIDRYNDSVIGNLMQRIRKGAGSQIPDAPLPEGQPDEEELLAAKEKLEQRAEESENMEPPSFEEEQTGIRELETSIAGMREQLAAEQPESPLLAELDGAAEKLAGLAADLEEKTSSLMPGDYAEAAKTAAELYGELYGAYSDLSDAYSTAQHTLEEYPADTVAIVREIEEKEAGLLQHPALPPKMKKEMQELFDKAPAGEDLSTLLAYHAALEQMAFALGQQHKEEGALKDEVLKDEIIKTLTKGIAALKEEELSGWKQVSGDIPETGVRVEELNSSFAAIMAGYKESVGMQHASLLEDLYALDEQANTMLAQIQDPASRISGGEPVADMGAGQVVSGQAEIGSQLIALSNTMNAVAGRQDTITGYARDLQDKANGFEKTTNVFSDRWRRNLEAIDAFNNDIQGFLDNTYVDGQENGYVFDHFINPLQAKGEAVAGEELKKVPPVILYVIMLISSLSIGFFSHKLRDGSPLLRTGFLGLLSLITGLIISLYSVNMYALNDQRAVEWTIFTILVIVAGAALLSTALDANETAGWIAAIVLMCLYIAPLLILGVPEANVPDILSPVYTSIKYDPDTLFDTGAAIAGIAAVLMLISAWLVKRWEKNGETPAQEDSYEV